MNKNIKSLKKFWKNKKVFLTGHTGFKGSWFCLLLNFLGAKVAGYSLKPKSKEDLYNLLELDKKIIQSTIGDIRNYKKLKRSILKFSPHFIVHMAAQPLVIDSYINPKYTYEVNFNGTLNILNILNELNFIKSALIITTDKVYNNNNNNNKFYKESDRLGGFDPYSNSKACAEFVVSTYNESFFKKKKIFVATARAGNIIGGGDFSKKRIIPDYFQSLKKNKKLILRSPKSIRPWQFVMEPLYGYLLLLINLYKKKNNEVNFNFGPRKSSNRSVIDVINIINNKFDNRVKIIKKKNCNNKYYESKILRLNSYKAKKFLRWEPQYNLETSINQAALWYKKFMVDKKILNFSKQQIFKYLSRLK